jgi:hypothetical protein
LKYFCILHIIFVYYAHHHHHDSSSETDISVSVRSSGYVLSLRLAKCGRVTESQTNLQSPKNVHSLSRSGIGGANSMMFDVITEDPGPDPPPSPP